MISTQKVVFISKKVSKLNLLLFVIALVCSNFLLCFNSFADMFDGKDVYYASNADGHISTNTIYASSISYDKPSPDKVPTSDSFAPFNATMTTNTTFYNDNYNVNPAIDYSNGNIYSNNYYQSNVYIPYNADNYYNPDPYTSYDTNNLMMHDNQSTLNNLIQYDNSNENNISKDNANNNSLNDLVQRNLQPASPAKPESLINSPIITNRLLPYQNPVESEPENPLAPYEEILKYHFGTANFAYNLNPDGSYTLSNNIIISADGKVVDIAGNTYNADGSITSITGTTRFKNGSIKDEKGLIYNLDGTINLPEGSYIDTNGITHNNDGSVILSDGTIYNTDGSIVYPNGTVLTQSGRVIKRTKKATEREELSREQNAWKYDPISNQWQQGSNSANSSIYK